MVTKIIHAADIHIRNLRRMEEYQEQLQKFIDECKAVAEENGKDETRIVIAGDLLHNKLDISGEGYLLASWFLRQLDGIAKTLVIAGNHDMNMANLSRLDPISVIFSMCTFKQVIYLDKYLNYQSGCLVDDNIVWCLYSSFDGFAAPDINAVKLANGNENLTFVGLFHGVMKGSKTDVGFAFENGYEGGYFDGCDCVMIGHVHKRQNLVHDGIPMVYSGSLIQQDHGENVSSHGYVLWDMENMAFAEKNIANENHGFYTFAINSSDDIDSDLEEVINL